MREQAGHRDGGAPAHQVLARRQKLLILYATNNGGSALLKELAAGPRATRPAGLLVDGFWRERLINDTAL